MSKKEILEQLKESIIKLDDDKVPVLIKQALKEGLTPNEIVNDGLNRGLTIIGEGFVANTRFMSELMLAGEIMTDAMDILGPEMEKGGKATGDVMVLGAVEGDLHTVGKGMVAAMFTGSGFKVINIGENCSAQQFVDALKQHKANVLGMSAILNGTKPYCKVVVDAVKKAGLRDKLVIAIGGWCMTQDWVNEAGADCYGENAVDGLHKVKALLAGEIKKKR